jgi:hypothetical protein
MSAWLFDQWELVDQWIGDNKSEVFKAHPLDPT